MEKKCHITFFNLRKVWLNRPFLSIRTIGLLYGFLEGVNFLAFGSEVSLLLHGEQRVFYKISWNWCIWYLIRCFIMSVRPGCDVRMSKISSHNAHNNCFRYSLSVVSIVTSLYVSVSSCIVISSTISDTDENVHYSIPIISLQQVDMKGTLASVCSYIYLIVYIWYFTDNEKRTFPCTCHLWAISWKEY